ncbi:DUF559 domain-containing protein [Tenggerimyces flavus]|uniref:DUF559 domain-containing protein n=1 Tax=Tenggerimyces flavus TaxID=1708749 RepID=A0ABV7Y573_9ACTN|nr:DUF559 domain-containing protein [Tenggerimyces flavus]MBM7790851.1 very-short-patch-repair endonuclease [Tenggerimyces flavus]
MVRIDQLLAAGITRAQIRAHVAARRWQRIHPRVHALFTGPLPRAAELWAAVLYAGSGAVLSFESAAEVWGLNERTVGPVHVTIPSTRRVTPQAGLRIHTAEGLEAARHPTKRPPVTRVEDTVIDLIDKAKNLEEVMTWITRACQRRRTTPDRLHAALNARPRQAWRDLTAKVLAEVEDGAESPLELEYVRRVERPHNLPSAARQRKIATGHWVDAIYENYRLIVELDGRLGHIEEGVFRDHKRDNRSTERGFATLRFGWSDVMGNTCSIAEQVMSALRRNGWRSESKKCGAGCQLARAA